MSGIRTRAIETVNVFVMEFRLWKDIFYSAPKCGQGSNLSDINPTLSKNLFQSFDFQIWQIINM